MTRKRPNKPVESYLETEEEESSTQAEEDLVGLGKGPHVIQWPSVTKAAIRVGLSPQKLMRMAQEGVIRTAKAPDGSLRFHPEDLEDYLKAEDDNPKPRPVEVEIAAMFKQMREFNAQTQSHVDSLVRLLVEPVRRNNELLVTENTRLADRCAELEQGRLEQIGLAEQMASERHARELATQNAEAAEKRRAAAFDLLMRQGLPRLLAQLGDAGGAAPAPDAMLTAQQREKVSAAIALLSDLDPEQLSLLLDSGLLTDSQAAQVRKIVGETPPAPPPPPPPPEKASAENG